MSLKDKKILVVGASSDLATALNRILQDEGAVIGLHYNSNRLSLRQYGDGDKCHLFQKHLDSSAACYCLVDDFVDWAKGIDGLVQLSGNISRSVHWEELTEDDWSYDLLMNLLTPFYLAQRAIMHMHNGGRILLTSTASASHGGGTSSLAYGAAKAGVECIVKRLAKDCAQDNILINAIAPGFIVTKFHTDKMGRTKEQLQQRAELVPLKRPGTVKEIAETIVFMISERASFITGQTIAVSGGDWL